MLESGGSSVHIHWTCRRQERRRRPPGDRRVERVGEQGKLTPFPCALSWRSWLAATRRSPVRPCPPHAVRARYPKDVGLFFVHFPLPMHRFARPAARATECAGLQGKFGQMVDAVYNKQDSLGLKSWSDYGRDAGVADTVAFRLACRELLLLSESMRALRSQRNSGCKALLRCSLTDGACSEA
jgi:hypothetical protein